MLGKMFPGLDSVIFFIIAGVVFVVIVGAICAAPAIF